MAHAIGPVFEIDIDLYTQLLCISDRFPDVCNMLFRRFSELSCQVLEGSLAKEVQHLSAGLVNPVQRAVFIDKTKDFDPVEMPVLRAPTEDFGSRFKLTL